MLQRLFRRDKAAIVSGPIEASNPAVVDFLRGDRAASSGVRVNVSTAIGYPPFWRGLNLICNGVAKPKLYVYERVTEDERLRAHRHPAYPLLTRKANPLMTAVAFRRLLQLWALTWGNGCAWIERDALGQPVALWPLLPDRTTAHVIDASGEKQAGITGGVRVVYVSDIGGVKHTFRWEDVLHIKGLSFNGHVGVPVVEVMRGALGLGMAAQEYGSRFFGQGATASGVLMAPPNMRAEQMEEFSRAIRESVEGLGKSHKLLVVGSGTDYKQLTIPPEHAQFLQTREFQLKDVANILGVQAHKLGDSSRTSYASLEQSNQEHLDDDLDPWFVTWEAECGDKLLTEEEKRDETHYVEFNRDALIRLDSAAQSNAFATGRQWGFLSANDIRRMKNLPPVEGGDVYLSPSNMVPADMLGKLTPTNPQ